MQGNGLLVQGAASLDYLMARARQANSATFDFHQPIAQKAIALGIQTRGLKIERYQRKLAPIGGGRRPGSAQQLAHDSRPSLGVGAASTRWRVEVGQLHGQPSWPTL